MALSRDRVIEGALHILGSYGLADLSMRRLAKDLDVQAGALYWHVKNKQELLRLLARKILAPVPVSASGADVEQSVRLTVVEIRKALLSVRDAAEVVSLVYALDPASLDAVGQLEGLLGEGPLTPRQAHWGARTLMHYILGAVGEEQTHSNLIAAGLVPASAAGLSEGSSGEEGFQFGIEAILSGLMAQPRRED